MNSLFTRLSAALLSIVALMGAGFYIVDRISTRAYYEELSQRLNAPIAMYVTGQRPLITAGEPDLEGLRALAGHAMVINPSIEIYLLDTSGRILGHDLPSDTVLRERVDLEPVLALIDGRARMPIRGDDPRSLDDRKVFSASEVISPQGLEGYLYVILGGQAYEALARDIGGSYVFQVSTAAAVGIVIFAAIVGLLVFALLTRRLKLLSDDMRAVSDSGFERAPSLERPEGPMDEIDTLIGAFVDMSARIKDQIEQLKENDRLRRELVSNISHDLRTPLAAIQGYLETLIIKADTMVPEDRDRYLRIARKHTQRLGNLVEDLFELSKLDSASAALNPEMFSLAELVQDVAQEFQLESDREGIALTVELDAERTDTMGDIGLIQRVLENLVRNAISFTPRGGAVTISISERPLETISVSVSDNGPGIPEASLPHIFDRFYRGEEARGDSSGLGLAIVKRILDLHHSRISVTSKPDAGTRFEFDLPVAKRAA